MLPLGGMVAMAGENPDEAKMIIEKGMMASRARLAAKKARTIERFITIKFVIFFMVSILLFAFFWYFLSCFCGVNI